MLLNEFYDNRGIEIKGMKLLEDRSIGGFSAATGFFDNTFLSDFISSRCSNE